MLDRLLADLVVALHVAYIAFVLLGAVLVRYRRRALWPHLAAVAWGAYIAFAGRVCPLTPLEVSLRLRAGEAGYSGGFVEHYVLPVLYPSGLTPAVLIAEGVLVLGLNAALYAWAWRAWRRGPRLAEARREG